MFGPNKGDDESDQIDAGVNGFGNDGHRSDRQAHRKLHGREDGVRDHG